MKSLTLLLTLMIPLISMAQKNPRNIEINWKTDTSKHLVSLDEFTALMKPDGIPPIDAPKFWDKETALNAYFLHEPVIAVEINGESKAYPLSVLMYHEIVNDKLGGVTIAATYCPLCNAAIVFDRRLNFESKSYELDFGVSGMLRNSDLVMWDRQTESWWQQFTGEALVGKLSGAELTYVTSLLISLTEFFQTFPQGKVLSTETGHGSKYGSNPYTGYDDKENIQPFLYKGDVDARLPAMERVIDIQVNRKFKIYPLSVIQSKGIINDSFLEQAVVVFYTSKTVSVLDKNNISESKEVGSVTVFEPFVDGKLLTFDKIGLGFVDRQTGSEWNITGNCTAGPHKGAKLRPITHGNHFAFAWFAFHPECEIYSE
ncbi:MAG: DUF3179 domain-containing protein [Lentimicrobium sp.]|nr:DUF3179 domain-containing protein [Lentimicrobium sp.]